MTTKQELYRANKGVILYNLIPCEETYQEFLKFNVITPSVLKEIQALKHRVDKNEKILEFAMAANVTISQFSNALAAAGHSLLADHLRSEDLGQDMLFDVSTVAEALTGLDEHIQNKRMKENIFNFLTIKIKEFVSRRGLAGQGTKNINKAMEIKIKGAQENAKLNEIIFQQSQQLNDIEKHLDEAILNAESKGIELSELSRYLYELKGCHNEELGVQRAHNDASEKSLIRMSNRQKNQEGLVQKMYIKMDMYLKEVALRHGKQSYINSEKDINRQDFLLTYFEKADFALEKLFERISELEKIRGYYLELLDDNEFLMRNLGAKDSTKGLRDALNEFIATHEKTGKELMLQGDRDKMDLEIYMGLVERMEGEIKGLNETHMSLNQDINEKDKKIHQQDEMLASLRRRSLFETGMYPAKDTFPMKITHIQMPHIAETHAGGTLMQHTANLHKTEAGVTQRPKRAVATRQGGKHPKTEEQERDGVHVHSMALTPDIIDNLPQSKTTKTKASPMKTDKQVKSSQNRDDKKTLHRETSSTEFSDESKVHDGQADETESKERIDGRQDDQDRDDAGVDDFVQDELGQDDTLKSDREQVSVTIAGKAGGESDTDGAPPKRHSKDGMADDDEDAAFLNYFSSSGVDQRHQNEFGHAGLEPGKIPSTRASAREFGALVPGLDKSQSAKRHSEEFFEQDNARYSTLQTPRRPSALERISRFSFAPGSPQILQPAKDLAKPVSDIQTSVQPSSITPQPVMQESNVFVDLEMITSPQIKEVFVIELASRGTNVRGYYHAYPHMLRQDLAKGKYQSDVTKNVVQRLMNALEESAVQDMKASYATDQSRAYGIRGKTMPVIQLSLIEYDSLMATGRILRTLLVPKAARPSVNVTKTHVAPGALSDNKPPRRLLFGTPVATSVEDQAVEKTDSKTTLKEGPTWQKYGSWAKPRGNRVVLALEVVKPDKETFKDRMVVLDFDEFKEIVASLNDSGLLNPPSLSVLQKIIGVVEREEISQMLWDVFKNTEIFRSLKLTAAEYQNIKHLYYTLKVYLLDSEGRKKLEHDDGDSIAATVLSRYTKKGTSSIGSSKKSTRSHHVDTFNTLKGVPNSIGSVLHNRNNSHRILLPKIRRCIPRTPTLPKISHCTSTAVLCRIRRCTLSTAALPRIRECTQHTPVGSNADLTSRTKAISEQIQRVESQAILRLSNFGRPQPLANIIAEEKSKLGI